MDDPAKSGSGLERLEEAFQLYCEFEDSPVPASKRDFLAEHAELRDLLEPMFDDAAAASPDPDPRVVGDFRIEHELGRGGMGVVYQAVQLSLGRSVALKMLPSHVSASPRSITRFKREAAVMARLSHPGLAEVYQVGQEGDAFYFAMELVPGVPFDEAMRAEPDARKRQRRTVRLAAQVADALDHAHEHGVIHRDVKPGNILVVPASGTTEARAVLTDFGLSREESLPSLTRSGDFAGTPYYLAPEQVSGATIDRRADVFALGVTLYELLTGVRPFEGDTVQEILRRIATKDPVDPVRLVPALHGDLSAVVLKALDKDPARRYASCRELADDLRAFLAGRPVRARRASTLSRMVRAAKREPLRAGLIAVLAVGVPLLAGLVGYVAGNIDEIDVGRRELAQERIDAHLIRGFTSLETNQAGLALAEFEAALAIDPARPESVVAKAMALRRLGRGDEARGVTAGEPRDGALGFYLAAVRELDRVHGLPPGSAAFNRPYRLALQAVQAAPRARPLYHFQCAHAAGHLARREVSESIATAIESLWPDMAPAWLWTGAAWANVDDTRAEQAYRRAASLAPRDTRVLLSLTRLLQRTGKLGAAREVLDRLMRADGGSPLVLEAMGDWLWKSGEPAAAVPWFEKALAAAPAMAETRSNMGLILLELGRKKEAETAFRAALEHEQSLPEAHANLAQLQAASGHTREAEAEYRRALQLAPWLDQAWFELGVLLQRQQRFAEAEACYGKALARGGPRSSVLTNLGLVLAKTGRPKLAEARQREALKLDADDATVRFNLACLLSQEGRRREAVRYFEAVVRAQPSNLDAWLGLGACRFGLNRFEAAEHAYRKAMATAPKHAAAVTGAAQCLAARRENAAAEALFKRSLDLDARDAHTQLAFGAFLSGVDRHRAAVSHLAKACALDPDNAVAHYNLGVALAAIGSRDKATACYRRALALNPGFAQAETNLAALLLDETDLFVSGEGGYRGYRIPSCVVTKRGTVLAFAEGRKASLSDSGDIDILLRRSQDSGKTWSEPRVVWDDAANTCGNPCAVVDRETGTVWLLLTWNACSRGERRVKAGFGLDSRRVFVTHSDDDGATWAEPEDITVHVKKKAWTWYATGPGAGIRIEHGEHAGRLVIPCDHKEQDGERQRYLSHVIWSDDHGKTWQLGGSSPRDTVNECEVVELEGGRLLLNMRSYDRKVHARQVCFSADGGATWTDQRHDEALVEPTCQASIRRCRWPKDGEPGVILFSNPASTRRERLTVRASYDGGKTWKHARLLHAGSSAYSCLCVLGDGRIGCFYEKDGYGRMTFARFRLEWVGGG